MPAVRMDLSPRQELGCAGPQPNCGQRPEAAGPGGYLSTSTEVYSVLATGMADCDCNVNPLNSHGIRGLVPSVPRAQHGRLPGFMQPSESSFATHCS